MNQITDTLQNIVTLKSDIQNNDLQSTVLNDEKINISNSKIKILIKSSSNIDDILKINNFESDNCIEILLTAIKGKIIKLLKEEKYWKFSRNKWVSCSYDDSVSYMNELFEAHLNSFVYDDNISVENKKKIKNRIGKWKKSTPDKDVIFDKLSVDMKYLTDNSIDFKEIEKQKVNINPKIIVNLAPQGNLGNKVFKESPDDIVKNFINEKILTTNNKDDILYYHEIYNIFIAWQIINRYPVMNYTIFGKMLKKNIPTFVKARNNSYYTNVEIKK
jgi:hypothetical protein